MKFLTINTAISPHFVAFFDEENHCHHHWYDTKQSGKEIFLFCEKHLSNMHHMKWVGGVSGPGGFSSLRITGNILSTFATLQDIPIKSVSSIEWLTAWYAKNSAKKTQEAGFFIESFGDKVFLVRPQTQPELMTVAEAQHYDTLPDVSFLSDRKQPLFSQKPLFSIPENITTLSEELRKNLSQQSNGETFTPEYFFDGI